MSGVKRGLFDRDPRTVGMGKGLSISYFDGGQPICDGDGDIGSRERLYAIRKYPSDRREEGDTVNKESADVGEPSSSNMKSSHYKVLVVDNEEPVRTFVVRLLSRKGHSCSTAADGTEALEKMNSDRFDAVITNIVMKKMDGLALTKEILERYPGFPMMVMTGYSADLHVEEAIEVGVREFIKKPFSMDEIIIRFEKMMRHHKKEAALVALSLTDALTGLYNRRRFFLLAEQHSKV
ncbi:MAG: response regulator [Thermodesulfobacteriota bacterium]|jgi:PleD family two-component response regulator